MVSGSAAAGGKDSASSSAAVGRKDADRFRFAVSLAVPEEHLRAWFDQAAPGERIVYCHGYVPLRDNPAWKLAGAWAGAGLVHLVTERDGAQTRWIAERRDGAAGVAGAGLVPPAGSETVLQLQLAALLDLLREAAAKGARCPSFTALARAVTGQTSKRARNRVTYLRRCLEAQGKIAVAPGNHNQAPVVTILARGKGCGLSTKGNDHAAP